MPPEIKIIVLHFVDGLNVEKPGDLYNHIIAYVKEHRRTEPRRLSEYSKANEANNPQGTGR